MKYSSVIATVLIAPLSIYAFSFDGFNDLSEASISKAKHHHRVKHEPHHPDHTSIIDVLRNDDRFTKLVEILENNENLQDELQGEQMTLFAPTNEAFESIEEEMKNRGHEPRYDMDEILRYHIVNEQWKSEDIFNGLTMETKLKLKKLNDKPQRIRVFKYEGSYWLNMHSRLESTDIEAKNGVIHAINRVLIPPRNSYEIINRYPQIFSTFLYAIKRCGLEKQLKETSMTLLLPSNRVWMLLGPMNLAYLFSKKGEKDLKKIVMSHLIPNEITYASDLIHVKEMEWETMNEGFNVKVEAAEYIHYSGHHHKHHSCHFDLMEKNEECPLKYRFVMNEGESRVTFTDAVVENGNMFMVSHVIVPENVELFDC